MAQLALPVETCNKFKIKACAVKFRQTFICLTAVCKVKKKRYKEINILETNFDHCSDVVVLEKGIESVCIIRV